MAADGGCHETLSGLDVGIRQLFLPKANCFKIDSIGVVEFV
jgi:hypothetical protein